MAQPAAVVFALSMAVWVADVRFAPKPVLLDAPSQASTLSCQSGPNSATPDGADAEVVVCALRAR